MSDSTNKVLREGSAQKRTAILDAARDLFMADGFERSSVDGIAARAEVSKRTVYDYFGDKELLLVAVVSAVGETLVQSVQQALRDDLGGEFSTGADLEAALIRFSTRIANSTLGSADYVALTRLVSVEAVRVPQLFDVMAVSEPEELLAQRFAELDRAGLLHAPDARLAADHFVALTFSSSYDNARFGVRRDDAETERLISEGVRAFLRAYAPAAGAEDLER